MKHNPNTMGLLINNTKFSFQNNLPFIENYKIFLKYNNYRPLGNDFMPLVVFSK